MTPNSIDVPHILAQTFVARVEYYASIPSTNDRAKQCAVQGPGELPLLVVADQQTAGRGRGTRRWWTGRGSLAFSLLVDAATLGADRGHSPLVALAAALTIVDTVAPLLPAHGVGIHWPNDVYAAGGKLAGILVEVLPDRRHVVGIGLNTNNTRAEFPPELQQNAATLRDLSGQQHDQTRILTTLLTNLEDNFRLLTTNPEQISARADQLCLQRGQTLTLELGQECFTGRCAGIAPDGALVLEMAQGTRSFYSGILS